MLKNHTQKQYSMPHIDMFIPFNIAETKIKEIIQQTEDALANYSKYAKEFGIK